MKKFPTLTSPLILIAGSFLLFSGTVSAQSVLVNYLDGTASTVPSNVAPEITASNISGNQSGVTGFSSGSGNAYWFINGTGGSATPLAQTRNDALAGNAYFEFTLTPQIDNTLDLGQLAFKMGHASPARTLHIYAAATLSFNEQTYTLDALFGEDNFYVATSANSNAGAVPATATIDLQHLPLTGITDAVTFRIYTWYTLITGEPIPAGPNHSIRLGEISISSIPEPGVTTTLLLLLPLSVWMIRKARHEPR